VFCCTRHILRTYQNEYSRTLLSIIEFAQFFDIHEPFNNLEWDSASTKRQTQHSSTNVPALLSKTARKLADFIGFRRGTCRSLDTYFLRIQRRAPRHLAVGLSCKLRRLVLTTSAHLVTVVLRISKRSDPLILSLGLGN
jgi:hypothetical protein